ncbi:MULTISPECIES: hypothetical protein [Amycolatopsis]|uniref:Uncharacterized protein n=1 Tax=Amycolatopsis albidoflavus TaxID=102226 RepID=A0ABW5HSX5_9PSEU
MSADGADLHWSGNSWEPYGAFAGVPDDEHDFEKILSSQGWEEFLSLGNGETIGFAMRVFIRHSRDTAARSHPEFLLEIGGHSSIAPYLKADDLPTAMDLLARWAPTLQASSIADLAQDLTSGAIEPNGLVETVAARAKWAAENRTPSMARDHDRLEQLARDRRRGRQP